MCPMAVLVTKNNQNNIVFKYSKQKKKLLSDFSENNFAIRRQRWLIKGILEIRGM